MKADKNDNNTNTITGKVVKKMFAKGSKSEHEAVCIESKAGLYKLKRMGGNPFRDPELEKFVGKTVKATGIIDDYQFIATELKEVD